MSVEHIRKYLGLLEEENPFYTRGKPDLNKVSEPRGSGFQGYPMRAPTWDFAEKQKEIYQKYPDKIVYNPTGPRSFSNIDWEETEKNISGGAGTTPTTQPPSQTTQQPAPAPSEPAATGEKEYDRAGDDRALDSSQALLTQLKSDFKYKFNKDLVTNSEERTREKQQDLYDRWKKGEKGIYTPTNPTKYPNAKWFHLNAFDASNISAKEEEWLKSVGWVRTNKVNDPVHFAYAGKPAPRPMTPEKKAWIESTKKNNPNIDDEQLSDHYDKFIYEPKSTQSNKPQPTKTQTTKTEKPNVITDPNKAEADRKRAEELAKASERMRQEVEKPKPGSGVIKRESIAKGIVESFGYKFETFDDNAVDRIRQREIDQGKASELTKGWEKVRRDKRRERKEKEAELALQRANNPDITTPQNPGMSKYTLPTRSSLDDLDRTLPSQQDIVNQRFKDKPSSNAIRGEPRTVLGSPINTSPGTKLGKIPKVGLGALSAYGTYQSISDIVDDVKEGDYWTAALEVAANIAGFLSIPVAAGVTALTANPVAGVAVGAAAGLGASTAIGSQAQTRREERKKTAIQAQAENSRKLKEAEDLLQKCQLTLNTGQTADKDPIDPATQELLQKCIDNAKATIDKLKNSK